MLDKCSGSPGIWITLGLTPRVSQTKSRPGIFCKIVLNTHSVKNEYPYGDRIFELESHGKFQTMVIVPLTLITLSPDSIA